MNLVTLSEFARDHRAGETSDLKIGYRQILYTNATGERCLLDEVNSSAVEDALLIQKDGEKITIDDPDKEKKKQEAAQHKFNRVANFVVLTAMAIVAIMLPSWFRPNRENAKIIAEKVQQLNTIQTSLKNLDQFIAAQKDDLSAVAQTVEGLNAKKQETEALLLLSSRQVSAVQQALSERRSKDKWMDIGIGILIGLISSALYHFVSGFLFKAKRTPSL